MVLLLLLRVGSFSGPASTAVSFALEERSKCSTLAKQLAVDVHVDQLTLRVALVGVEVLVLSPAL